MRVSLKGILSKSKKLSVFRDCRSLRIEMFISLAFKLHIFICSVIGYGISESFFFFVYKSEVI